MDLPEIDPIKKYVLGMALASTALTPEREITAFFYRDWRSVYSRYESDLRQLRKGLMNGSLPPGDANARRRMH